MANTIINIPGRETQTLAGMTLTEADVRTAYSGTIDLTSYVATASVVDGDTVITFANRTGTKGANTIINIPGRETQTLAGMTLTEADVRTAYSGTIDLTSYVATASVVDGDTVITFANRTGTKGADTIINIPGRETQTLAGMTLTEADVRTAYSGTIDLTSYVATSTVTNGDTVITFANRTGTKGNEFNALMQALLSAGIVVAGEFPAEEAEEEAEEELDLTGVVSTQLVLNGDEPFSTVYGVLDEERAINLAVVLVGDMESYVYETYVENDVLVYNFYIADESEEEEDFGSFEDDDEVELTNTLVCICGMEPRALPGMVMDASQLVAAYSGTLDLSQYQAEETVRDDTLVVTFTKMQGTKGA